MSDYLRRCPSCGATNAPEALRCACGALLAGVDLERSEAPSATPAATAPEPAVEADATPMMRRCPHVDCAQLNPPEAETCLYCNRSLAAPEDTSASLLQLPPELAADHRIVKPIAANGAESDLLLVEGNADGVHRVAKIYRHGIVPKREVLERIARIDLAHRVEILRHGVSRGHAFELMEYCAEGSLRDFMARGPLDAGKVREIVIEIAIALEAVHAAGIVHRDLKPENVLVRSFTPLDLVLTDFGTASVLDRTQRFTGVARTLPYAAPETLSGVIDTKADYWALGMIVLEASLGKHPFSGLSEAVVLHHLATRGIDATAIEDDALRRLARGLLLRDPARRWGAAELERWRRGDETLEAPVETGADGSFREPYRIAGEASVNAQQLAAALSRHWREGVIDLANGQLLNWFRETQKDQDVVRLLIEARFEKKWHVDVQLLTLILHLAPGIPPVWRGAPLDLATLATLANRALAGHADARTALSELHERRVLEIYARRGNAFASEVFERWTQLADRFADTWAQWQALMERNRVKPQPGEVVNYDDLVYGLPGATCPPLADVHPRLLASAFDSRWAARWRERLAADLAALQASLPWLAAVGDIGKLKRVDLFALESLLPELRQRAAQADQARDAQERHASENHTEILSHARATLSELRAAGKSFTDRRDALTRLDDAISEFYTCHAALRASPAAANDARELIDTYTRAERHVDTLRSTALKLAEHRALSAGWLNGPMLGLALVAIIVLARFLRQWALFLGVGLGLVAVFWRYLPALTLVHRIRALALRI